MPENIDEATATNGPEVTDDTATADVSAADTSTDTEADPAGADALGDPGKRALDSMKAQRNAERERRRALEAQLAELQAPKPAEDGQLDADAIRAQAAREATAKANTRILRSEVKAAAAGRLKDPSDAFAHLELSSFEVDANGDVDASEISDAIEDLLTRKPYLAASSRPRFEGTADGGAARTPSGPAQLTRQDLDGMSPEAIVQAKREGRLKDILSGK